MLKASQVNIAIKLMYFKYEAMFTFSIIDMKHINDSLLHIKTYGYILFTDLYSLLLDHL